MLTIQIDMPAWKGGISEGPTSRQRTAGNQWLMKEGELTLCKDGPSNTQCEMVSTEVIYTNNMKLSRLYSYIYVLIYVCITIKKKRLSRVRNNTMWEGFEGGNMRGKESGKRHTSLFKKAYKLLFCKHPPPGVSLYACSSPAAGQLSMHSPFLWLPWSRFSHLFELTLWCPLSPGISLIRTCTDYSAFVDIWLLPS